MRTLEVSKAKQPLEKYIPALGREALILTRKGKAVAVLMGTKDSDCESVALATNPKFLAILRHSEERMKRERALSWEEVSEQINKKAAGARGANRTGRPRGRAIP